MFYNRLKNLNELEKMMGRGETRKTDFPPNQSIELSSIKIFETNIMTNHNR